MVNKITGNTNLDNELFTKLGNLQTALDLTIEQMKNMNAEFKQHNQKENETQTIIKLLEQRLLIVEKHIENHCNLLDGETSLVTTVRDLKKAEDSRKEESVEEKTEWSNLKIGLLVGLATLLGGFFFAIIQLLLEKYYIKP